MGRVKSERGKKEKILWAPRSEKWGRRWTRHQSRDSTTARGVTIPEQIPTLQPMGCSRCVFLEGTVAHGYPTLEQGKSERRKGQQRGAVMDWPQPPFPIRPPHCLGWEDTGVGNKVEPGREGVRDKVFYLVFVFVSHYPNMLAINYINFPHTKPFLPMMLICKWSPCLHLDPGALSSYSSTRTVMLRKRSQRAARWACASWPWSTHHRRMVKWYKKRFSCIPFIHSCVGKPL